MISGAPKFLNTAMEAAKISCAASSLNTATEATMISYATNSVTITPLSFLRRHGPLSYRHHDGFLICQHPRFHRLPKLSWKFLDLSVFLFIWPSPATTPGDPHSLPPWFYYILREVAPSGRGEYCHNLLSPCLSAQHATSPIVSSNPACHHSTLHLQ